MKKLNQLNQETRNEISVIYANDKTNIRKTYAIAKKYFKEDIEKDNLICFACGKKIEGKNYTIHAIIHAVVSDDIYWGKENLKLVHKKACHDSIDIEKYKLSSGEIVEFKKSDLEKPYRDYLNNSNLL